MADEYTLFMPSSANQDDKRKWVQQVKNCETDVCQWGYAIRGLLQSGRFIYIVHDPEVRHTCSFRGTITDEMELRYNHAPPDS